MGRNAQSAGPASPGAERGLRCGGSRIAALVVAVAALLIDAAPLRLAVAESEPAADVAPAVDSAPPRLESEDDAIVLNFESADIREVVNSLAGALGISYMLDPRVEGQVTIRTSGKIPRRDLFPIFNQILRSNGFSAVRTGEVFQIIPIGDAKTRAIVPQAQRAQMAADDLFAIELVSLKNVTAQEMATLLQPFVTPGGDAIPYPRSNLIILTDLISNIDRLREMIALLDRDSFKDLQARVYKIKEANIESLGQELIDVLSRYQITGEAAAERGVYAIPLIRLNSVVVLAFNADAFKAVEYWLKILDVPPDSQTNRTVRVYPVQNAKAADLAAVLSALYGGGGGGGGGGLGRPQPGQPGGGLTSLGGGLGGGGSGSGRLGGRSGGSGGGLGGGGGSLGGGGARGSAAGGGLGGGGSGGLGGGGRGGRGALGGGSSAQPAGALAGAAGGAGGGAAGFTLPGGEGPMAIFQNPVNIVADEVTNSLVILASKRDYDQISLVLKDLDLVPRQVQIEVLIAEISLNKSMEMGLTAILANNNVNGISTPVPSAAPTSSAADGEALGALGGVLAGAAAEAAKRSIELISQDGSPLYRATITDNKTFFAQLTALASAGRAKVLAAPSILTADNREARLLIGSQIPVLTQNANLGGIQSNGTSTLVSSIQYRDTGVQLAVLPQVNADGLVNMQVRHTLSEVGQESFGSTGSPSFNTREAETTAVVQNGDTLVIGGIIQESTSRSRSGVPYLMDIPVVGRAFRFDNDTVRRTELMLMLTPRVVRSRDEGAHMTRDYGRRLRDVVHEIERTRGVLPMSDAERRRIDRMRSRATTADRPNFPPVPEPDEAQ